MRTCAEGATSEDFLTDMEYLSRLWKQISAKISVCSAPSILYQDLYLESRALRDMVNENTTRVLVDSWDDNIEALSEFAENFVPTVADKLEMYTGEIPLFEQYGIENEIEKALSRRVDLKSGGYLIFDQNEAMSTIDVNTGAYVGKRDFGDTVFKTNLEAARVIARQLRLRNLGGIIIIDFIDMEKYDSADCHTEGSGGSGHPGGEVTEELVSIPQFTVSKITVHDPLSISNAHSGSFIIYIGINGEADIQVPDTSRDGSRRTESYRLKKGSALLVPADMPDFFIVPLERDTELLEVRMDRREEADSYINPDTEPYLEGEDYEGIETTTI